MASQFKILLVLMALLYLRWKRPDIHRPVKVPIIIVIFTLIALLVITIPAFITNPTTLGACLLLFILGIPLYFIGEVAKKSKRVESVMNWITIRLQLLLMVLPLKNDNKRKHIMAASFGK